MTKLSSESSLMVRLGVDSRGLTLIEMLVALAVLAILATIAAPSFTDMLATSRTQSAAEALKSASDFARSEAVQRNLKVVACPSTDGATCTGGTSWASGWIVWADADDNAILDAGESIVRAGTSFSATLTATGPATLSFSPLGNAGSATSFTVIHNNPSASRLVCVLSSGFSKIESSSC